MGITNIFLHCNCTSNGQFLLSVSLCPLRYRNINFVTTQVREGRGWTLYGHARAAQTNCMCVTKVKIWTGLCCLRTSHPHEKKISGHKVLAHYPEAPIHDGHILIMTYLLICYIQVGLLYHTAGGCSCGMQPERIQILLKLYLFPWLKNHFINFWNYMI